MLGDRIKAARKAAKLSQQDLAVALGVHTMTVSYYERGAWIPPDDRLEQIAEALNVDLSTLTSEAPKALHPDVVIPPEQRRSSSA